MVQSWQSLKTAYFGNIMKLVASLIIVCVFQGIVRSQDCKLRKDKDGIRVYACHQDTSAFKQLRAEFALRATREELLSVLKRVDHYPAWQYNMTEAQILKPLGENTFIYRSVVNAPWPVSDREMVVLFNAKLDESNRSLRIDVTRAQYDYPKSDNLVRIPYSIAQWDVVETTKGQLQIKYILTVDPGGTVPAWLLNMAIADGPFVSFRNLQKELSKD